MSFSTIDNIDAELGTFVYNQAGVASPFLTNGLFYTSDPNDRLSASFALNAVPAAAVSQAAASWSTAGASAAALANVTVAVANLPAGYLGLASESTSTVWIDDDAAGYGWSVVSGSWSVARTPRQPTTDHGQPITTN